MRSARRAAGTRRGATAAVEAPVLAVGEADAVGLADAVPLTVALVLGEALGSDAREAAGAGASHAPSSARPSAVPLPTSRRRRSTGRVVTG
jgi:hypothetical protein